MIKGIIFDMDGVISDTQKIHSSVESILLSKYGVNISPEEITKKYSGVRTKDFFAELLKKQIQAYDLDLLMEEKWKQMEYQASLSVQAISGAKELIEYLKVENYKLAVASASKLDYVKQVLKTLGLSDFFSALVGGDLVKKGKPDPESFLLAASMLNIDPQDCLVIEDGMSGMEAAESAGMQCIGLVADIDKNYPTKNLVTSLLQVTPVYIENML